MKASFWKTLTAMVLAVMLLTGGVAAAQARFPERAAALTDDANALSQQMTADIAAYAQKVEDVTGVKLNVVLVHFLDGEPVQTYADALFARWNLGEDDLLLLGAAAEDTFALATGSALGRKLTDGNLKSLLYSSAFESAFQAQRYDAAFGGFFVAFNTLLEKQFDTTVALGSLFAAYQPETAQAGASGQSIADSIAQAGEQLAGAAQEVASGVVQATSSLWNSTMDSIKGNVDDYQAYRDQRDENRGGLSPMGWIVLVIIVMVIFGQSEPARRARRRGGCGCGPLGWIFGLLGLSALFHRNR